MTGSVTADGYLRKARRALEEARVLLREQSSAGACNRAYYAMHDAAHAALLAEGREPPGSMIKTHHGLIGEFGRYLSETAELDAGLGRDFNRVQTIRLAADYSCEPPPMPTAQAAVAQAEAFVAAIQCLLADCR